MWSQMIAVVLLLSGSPAVVEPDAFSGDWEVTRIIEAKKDGYQWSLEIKYPKRMTLEVRDGRLEGRYTDQWKHSGKFELVAIVNGGHDLLLVHEGGTKSPEARSPVHHVKLVNGKLHGVVTSHDKLFEWIAERR
jgi:hypothetical protein